LHRALATGGKTSVCLVVRERVNRLIVAIECSSVNGQPKSNSYSYVLSAALKRGPRFLWTYFVDAMLFDLTQGTNTHLRQPKNPGEPVDASDDEYSDGLLYVASLTSTVRKSLQFVESLLGSAFVRYQFVDLGSGKGKTLLVYCKDHSRRGVPQAVGIEYSEPLCAIARRNLEKMRLGPETAKIVCDSAVNVLDHCRPEAGLIVYLYNSFQGKTLRQVLHKIETTPHVLVYVDPAERKLLEELGYETLKFNQGKYNATTWLVARKRGPREVEA
jgi:hypothetical protein